MPTFEVSGPGGAVYQIDAPDERAAFDAFQKATASPEPESNYSFSGLGKAALSGLAKGAIGLAGLPADIGQLFAPAGSETPFGSQALQRSVESHTGQFYKPQNRIEGAIDTAGQFAPAVLGGPESLLTKFATRVAAPAVASEAAGALTNDDPLAKTGAALLAGVAAPMANSIAARSVPTAATALPNDSIVAAADRLGMTIPKYLASDSMPVQRLAATVKNIPGVGDKIVKSAQGVGEGLGAAADRIAEGLGSANPVLAGADAKAGLVDWIKKGSQAPVREAYKAVDEALIHPDAMVPLTNTQKAVSEIMAERAGAKIPGMSGAVNAVNPGIQSQGMSYKNLKNLRSYLGERSPTELVAEGISPKEAKRLYGPMTEDLKQAVFAAGGENALSKWTEANTLASLTKSQQKELAKVVGSKGEATPEQVYGRLVSYAQNKGGAIDRLMLARNAIGPDKWKEVSSAMVSQLGRDAEGKFSMDRFMTAYGKLSEAGKATLFGDAKTSLDDIHKVVSGAAHKIKPFENTSKTASGVIGAGMLHSVFYEPFTLLGSMVGGHVLAKALASPASAKEISKFSKTYIAAKLNPSPASSAALASAKQRVLRALVIADPSLRASAKTADAGSQ